jgi:hypothetical protein
MVPAIKPWLGWAREQMTDKDQPVFRMALERKCGSKQGTEAMSALVLCRVRREPEWLFGLVYCGSDCEVQPRVEASPMIRDIHKSLVNLSWTIPHHWIAQRTNLYLVISNGKGVKPTVEDWLIQDNPVMYGHAQRLQAMLEELRVAHTDDQDKFAVVDYTSSHLKELLKTCRNVSTCA